MSDQDVLVIGAEDVRDALRGDKALGFLVLDALGALAPGGSILVRIDFPGKDSEAGGLEASPRRMGWFARRFWRLGTTPLRIPNLKGR